MKSILLFIFLGLTFTGICQTQCLVTHVIDGDTYQVLHQGKKTTIRIMNADAPELKQFFGRQAKDSIAALIHGRLIEATFYKTDLYGRTLTYLKLKGKRLDSLIIAKGWAYYYYKYSKEGELGILEAEARQRHLGIWECTNNVPPWIWRKLSSRNKRLYENCKPNPVANRLSG